jgi:hypothetical protein
VNLVAPEMPSYKFLIDIQPSKRARYKMTLHSQENNSYFGLLRVDFNGSHENPERISETLPDELKQYAGMKFRRESHIHLHVEGYKQLAWAIPLRDHVFPTKELTEPSDYLQAVVEFANLLHVHPMPRIQIGMML